MFEVPASQVRKIPGGEYDTIVCNGEATLLRDVRCDRLVLGGTLGGPYSLSAGFIEGHGTLSVRGGIRTNEASFSGLTILRSTLQVAGTLQTAGYLHCQANVIAGAVSIDGNAHAEGTITTGRLRAFAHMDLGRVNATEVSVVFEQKSQIRSLTGRVISLRRKEFDYLTRLFSSKKELAERSYLVVSEDIIGDHILLEYVRAKSVKGIDVTIGAGCRIEVVYYRDHIYIDETAWVGRYEPYGEPGQDEENTPDGAGNAGAPKGGKG